MAVNPIKFLVASNATVRSGDNYITVNGNVDCSRVYSGSAVFLGGADNPAEGVRGTSPDTNGVSTITLRRGWSQQELINQPLVVFNTNEGLADAIQNVREIVANISSIESLQGDGYLKKLSEGTYTLQGFEWRQNVSGSTVEDGGSIAGSELSPDQQGSWINVTGRSVPSNEFGLFLKEQ